MADEPKGRWKPGQSGNPSGRPRGARHKVTLACEALLDGEAETITRKLIEKAKEGDGLALRLCAERIMPVRKGRTVEIDLPPVTQASDLPPLIARIIEAVSDGELTPEEGAALGGMVEQSWRAHHMADTEARLKALEERNGAV